MKKKFIASDTHVAVDVAPLGACLSLVTCDLSLEFPFPYPTGKLCVSLVDSSGSCLSHVNCVRNQEQVLTAKFSGVMPGRYFPSLQTESGHAIPLAPMQVTAMDVHHKRSVVAESGVEVHVDALAVDWEVCRLVLVNEAGETLADPGRRSRQGLISADHLVAGTYYLQVLGEDRWVASWVTKIELRESERQSTALSLQPAGVVEVARRAEGGRIQMDLASESGLVSSFFVRRDKQRLWCPEGTYSAQANGRQFQLMVRSRTELRVTL